MNLPKKLNCNANAIYLTINVNMTEEKWRKFGQFLREEMQKARVKHKEVASKAGIDPIHLSRLVNGHSGAKSNTITDIVNAINELSKSGYKVNLELTLNKAGFTTDDLTTQEAIAGLEDLEPEAQKIAKRQIQAIIKTFAEAKSPSELPGREIFDGQNVSKN